MDDSIDIHAIFDYHLRDILLSLMQYTWNSFLIVSISSQLKLLVVIMVVLGRSLGWFPAQGE